MSHSCKCCCNCCNCCGSRKCKCEMRAAGCVTRQKRLQNAENLLLEIRVENSNKLIQSACVEPVDCCVPAPLSLSLSLPPVCVACLPSVNQCICACSAFHCAAPQSMQHKSAHNGVHACVCWPREREREGKRAAAGSRTRNRSQFSACACACARPRISIILINLLTFISSDKFALPGAQAESALGLQ